MGGRVGAWGSGAVLIGEEGVAESLVELHTWDETGAPEEHIGFGRFSNDAKNMQTAFFVKHLIQA